MEEEIPRCLMLEWTVLVLFEEALFEEGAFKRDERDVVVELFVA